MKRYSVNYTSRKVRNNLLYFLAVLFSVYGTGCDTVSQPGKDVLARYGGNQLLREEIDFFMPEDQPNLDSARYAEQYIDKWIRRQTIKEEAKKEIEDLDKKLQFALDNYEAELVASEFAKHIIDSKSEQIRVTEGDMLNHYTKYPERVVSNGNFYQFFYVRTILPNQYKLQNLMRSDEPEKIDELRQWAKDNANEWRLDSSYVQDSELDRISKGYYFGNIRKANTKTPYVYSSKEGKQTNFHFFRMLQVIEPGDQLPLRIVRDRIISSIKNQTINTMIQQTEARLIQAARKSNKIKIFDEE